MAARRKKVATEVRKGNRPAVLEALAAELVDRLNGAETKTVAGLARQLTIVLVELAPDDLDERLQSLADTLATLIDSPATPTENVAGMASQLRVVLDRLAAVEKPERSPVDEFTKRREARREQNAQVPHRRTGRQQRRR